MMPFFSKMPSWCKTLLAASLLTVLTLLLYADTFDSPFMFDDQSAILENPYIRMTEPTPAAISRLFKSPGNRPLADFTFALNYFFRGYDVRGYHTVNLIIHIIAAILIWLVSRKTLYLCNLKNELIPFFAATLWTVNPLHTQSVTYIVQRMNAMAAMFFMLALFCYIQGRLRQQKPEGRGLAISCFAGCGLAGLLGLASKETVAILPLVLLLYEWFFFQGLSLTWLKNRRFWIGTVIIIIIGLALVYMDGNPLSSFTTMYEGQLFTPAQRLLTQPAVVLYYVSLILFPHPARLTPAYDFPLARSAASPVVILSLFALIALLVLALSAARKHRLPAFTILWFFMTLIIESSIIGLALIYEHRTYLPAVFPVIALTVLIFHHIRPKALAIVILSAYTGICGLWTYQRNSTWKTALVFWEDALVKSPEQPLCANGIASAYYKIENYNNAIVFYEKALEIIDQKGGQPQGPLYNIGEILLRLDRPGQAVAYFEKALACDPEYGEAHTNLGAALLRLGRIDEAMRSSRRALEINPDLEAAYNNLGNAWFLKGDVKGAVNNFKRALAINPDYREARGNLEKVQQVIKKYGAYLDQLKTLAEQHPDDPNTAFQLGRLSQAAGMTDQAVFRYQQALSIEPSRTVYLNALSTALIALGRISEATTVLERLALQIPDNPTVFYNLACLYARRQITDKALTALKAAVDRGYDRWDHLRTDKDLENIRKTPYVQRLIGERLQSPSCKPSPGFENN